MGTTADKLTYLNETKNQIKSILNTPYNVFRDYPTLISKYVNNQPKSIAEGSTAICENAIDLPCNITVNGNYYQDTRDGYNLLDITKYREAGFSNTINGVTITFNKDGSITLNGTATADTDFYIVGSYTSSVEKFTLKAGTYTLYNGLYDGQIFLIYNSVVSINGVNIVTRTLTEDTPIASILLRVNSGASYTNKTIYPMLLEGTYTKDTLPPYEQYGAKPSLEEPSDIEVIDGLNRLNFDVYQDNRVTKNDDYTVTVNGGGYGLNFEPIILKTNQKYKVKFEIVEGTYNTAYENYLLMINDIWLYKNQYTEISVSEDTTISFAWINANANFVNTKVRIWLYEGTEDKPYLPYGHIGLVQRGKNYFNKNNAKLDTTFTGANIENSSVGIYASEIIPVKPNTNYYVNDYLSAVIGFDKNKNCTGYIANKSTAHIFNSGSNYYVRCRNYKPEVSNVDLAMLCEEKDGTDYEPYHYNLKEIDLAGNSIAKVGEIKDLLNIGVDGSVKIGDKVIKEYVFTGDETFSKVGHRFVISLLKGLIVGSATVDEISPILSNMLIARSPNETYLKNNGISVDTDGTVRIYIAEKEEVTADEFNTFLKELYNNGTPLKIMYATTDKQTIDLPSIEPIELFEGTNVFELVTNLGTTLAVEYVVNAESLTNEITELSNAVIELGGTL